MKRLLYILPLLLSFLVPGILHAQSVTVTGHTVSGNTSSLTSGTFMRFRLRNFSGNTPRVTTTGAIVKTQFDVVPDGTGLVTTPIYANDFIKPVNTYWTVEMWYNGVFQSSYNYGICLNTVLSYCTAAGITFNLDNASPISFPTPPPPYLPLPGPAGPPGPIGPPGPAGSGAGNPSAPGFSLQYANAAVNAFLGATGITTPDGTNLYLKGPDPWFDISAYGARPSGSAGFSTTASCNGTTAITLTSASAFHNGDGITITGCGATNTLSTPGAPTVTPSVASGGTTTGIVTNSATAASTYSYKIVARDKFGALTAAGAATTIGTGQATLGVTTATITTETRSNDTVTFNVSAPSLVVPGTLIHVTGASNPDFDGWFIVATMPTNQQGTINATNIDNRGIGWKFGESNGSSGGTIAFYLSNHVTWAAVANAWEYYIYGERPGDVSYNLMGVTKPSAGTWVDAQWDDYGATFMASQTFPAYVPTTAPSSATNDPLTTTIVSGAGTTSIVVANAATQTIAGQTANFDNAPAILAAANAAVGFGPVYIPPANGGNGFVINSYLALPVTTTIFQAGYIVLNETMELKASTIWDGHWSDFGQPQFGFTGSALVYILAANPGIYTAANGVSTSYVSFESGGTNGGVIWLSNNSVTEEFDYVNFVANFAGASDTLSTPVIFRSTSSGGNNYHFRKTLFNAGPDQTTNKSWTPMVYFPPNQNGSGGLFGNQSYLFRCMECFFNRRGIEEEMAGGGAGKWEFDGGYRQGGITPFISVENTAGNATGSFIFHNVIQDTEATGTLALWNNGGTFQANVDGDYLTNFSADVNGVPPPFTGYRVADLRSFGSTTGSVTNRSGTLSTTVGCGVTYPYDITGTNSCNMDPFVNFQQTVDFPSGNSLFWALPTPTGITVGAATAGGALAAGTYFYTISATGVDGGETVPQTVAASGTTAGGNLTLPVSWTGTLGATSYNIYRCTGASCVYSDGRIQNAGGWRQINRLVTATSINDGGGSLGQSPPTQTGTGITGLNATEIFSPKFLCPETTPPSGLVGFDILYCDSTAHQFKAINNNGSSQAFAGFTITPTNLDCVNWFGTSGLLGDPGGACARYTISPTNGDCVTWSGTGGLLGDAGAACGAGAGGMNTNMNNMANPTLMNQSLIPAAVNTIAVGSQTLEFTNVFIGTVANRSGSFDTTALTANRVIKFPDAASTAVQNCASVAHQFLTQILQSTGACSQAQPTLADIAAGIAPAGSFDFSGANIKLPQGAGFVATAANNIGIDTTANSTHLWINAADSIAAAFASAPAGSKCIQSSGTKGLLSEAAAVCGTTTPSSSDTFTNKTYNAESTGNALSEPVHLYFTAAGCNNSTAGNAWDLGTTNIPTPQCAGSTVRKGVLQFAHSNVGYLNWHLPKDWNSSAATDIEIGFTTTDTTNGHTIIWDIQTGCNAVDGTVTDDPALNAQQQLTTTIGGTQVSGGALTTYKSTLTMTGCVADDNIEIAIKRDAADTSTDAAVAVKFAEVVIGVTKNAANR